jgi:uncharacterized membrane protein (DUF2068 family)
MQCKAYFGTNIGGRCVEQYLPKQETKEDSRVIDTVVARPVGLSFASLFYAAAGIYYLAYPLAVQDYTLWYLFALGVVSLIASYGIYRLLRWGLWLGVLLYPPHLVVPASYLVSAISYSGVFQQPIAIALLVSLILLMLFATLAFLSLLDKRHSFTRMLW